MSDTITVTISEETISIDVSDPDFIQVNLLSPSVTISSDIAKNSAHRLGDGSDHEDVAFNSTFVDPGGYNDSSNKATPVDADILSIEDSASSFAKAKLTWANFKATLKTYFDGLYLAISGGTIANYNETVNVVTADDAETISSLVRSHRYTLTEACEFTAPSLPVSGQQSHLVKIQSETFVTSYNASPEIRWATSDKLPPTFDVTTGTLSSITLETESGLSYWIGRDSGETVAP